MRSIRTAALLAALGTAVPASAQAPGDDTNLQSWIRARKELSSAEKKAWEKQIMLKFGGRALDTPKEAGVGISVAKQIMAAAMFMGSDTKRAVDAAWEGWHGAIGYVPEPIAVHYQILGLQDRKPRGRMIDLAFKFPEYYTDEIAPDLVAWWEEGLEKGTIPDEALTETREALEATRIKMRPLLLDKLRLLARLARDLGVATGAAKAEISKDMGDVEAELMRSFKNVARRPEVLDAKKRPFDRLRIQLEDMGLPPSAEDRLLDPNAPPPPKREVPKEEPPPEPKREEGKPLVEPDRPPPPPPPPPQPRAGDPDKDLEQMGKMQLGELVERYRARLDRTIQPWLGTPYLWGGGEKRSGTDCSGFTRGVFREGFDVDLPRVSADQARVGRSVPRMDLRPGDLVFFDTMSKGRVTHVGVYVGAGDMAHASSSSGVVRAGLDSRYYQSRYLSARRVLAYPR